MSGKRETVNKLCKSTSPGLTKIKQKTVWNRFVSRIDNICQVLLPSWFATHALCIERQNGRMTTLEDSFPVGITGALKDTYFKESFIFT